jgi:hypothetical protein
MYMKERSSVQNQGLSPSPELVAAVPGGDIFSTEVSVSAQGSEETNGLRVVVGFSHGHSHSELILRYIASQLRGRSVLSSSVQRFRHMCIAPPNAMPDVRTAAVVQGAAKR